MSGNDPYFAVKDSSKTGSSIMDYTSLSNPKEPSEVQRQLVLVRALHQRCCGGAGGDGAPPPLHGGVGSRQEGGEGVLRAEVGASLRSIEWDLEDLDATISVVEKNPRQFSMSGAELRERRLFVDRTRAAVKEMRDSLALRSQPNGTHSVEYPDNDGVRKALLKGSGGGGSDGSRPPSKYTRLRQDDDDLRPPPTGGKGAELGGIRYMRLDGYDSNADLTNDRFIEHEMSTNQQMILRTQDETLDMMGSSVHVLKGMSRQIGNELDEQSVMLDEFAHEMERTDSKLETNMKKIAKVLHMSNDRRQWMAIGVLALALFIVLLLLIIL